MKTYNQQILQHRQDESITQVLSREKKFLHQTATYELVRREKTNMK
ncbi:Hypothetical predicted protein [Paramuricea clavata]|nr:Hypothetical predicted protein [Paramuricea clavata]